MGTYVLIDLLWAGGSVAPDQPTSLQWNWGIFAQTCSAFLEGPYRRDSSGAHPGRAIDWAWEPRIPFPCSLMAITLATGSKIGSSRSRWNTGTEYYPVGMKTHIMYPMLFMKEERHHVSQTTTLGASPPLILWFHPSKRHAALIASRDQGSIVLAFTLVLLVLKRFWWRVMLVILMFVACLLVDLSCFVAYHLRISCCLYAIMSSFLMASNVCLVSHHILYV